MGGDLPPVRWTIVRTFDGALADPRERVELGLAPRPGALVVTRQAPRCPQ